MAASIVRLGLAAIVSASAAAALAQESEQLDDLQRLYKGLVEGPDRIVTVDEGRDVLAALDDLVLDESSLDPNQLGQMLLCRIYGLLAIGDAASLEAYMAELQSVQPDAPTTHRAAHLVAAAMGDGKMGAAALGAMAKSLDATAKRQMAAKARRFRIVGSPAPALAVNANDGTSMDFANRAGKAMILFLWNARRTPSPDEIAAMQRIHAEQRSNGNVEIFGISANPSTLDGKARGFARTNGLRWPHHYEQRGTGAPVTHKAFKAGSSPAQIVIDIDGVIRAIGDIGVPAMEYAIRAAVAEADGRYPLPQSRAANGKLTPRGSARAASGQQSGHGNPKTAKKTAKPLEDNPDAENLMSRARLMIRLRNRQNAKMILQRIVREYPNTKQAKRALEMLTDLP